MDGMRQLQMFTTSQLAKMRDRTASRNYSPERDEFRRTHERHRAWGLARRHEERLRRLREGADDSRITSTAEACRDDPPPARPPESTAVGHAPRQAPGGKQTSRPATNAQQAPRPATNAQQAPRPVSGRRRPTSQDAPLRDARSGPAMIVDGDPPSRSLASNHQPPPAPAAQTQARPTPVRTAPASSAGNRRDHSRRPSPAPRRLPTTSPPSKRRQNRATAPTPITSGPHP
jgi:hypothetical protein